MAIGFLQNCDTATAPNKYRHSTKFDTATAPKEYRDSTKQDTAIAPKNTARAPS
jgi:hypothetical protein